MLGKERPPHLSKTLGRERGGGGWGKGGGKRNIPLLARKTDRVEREREGDREREIEAGRKREGGRRKREGEREGKRERERGRGKKREKHEKKSFNLILRQSVSKRMEATATK